jgi:hypothetical protein
MFFQVFRSSHFDQQPFKNMSCIITYHYVSLRKVILHETASLSRKHDVAALLAKAAETRRVAATSTEARDL